MQLHPMLLKLQARLALKGFWQTALLTAFAAGILVTASQTALQLSMTDAIASYWALLNQGYPLEYVVSKVNYALFILPAALYLLSLFLTPALQMGLKRFYMLRLLGQDAPFITVFSRMGIFFKAFLLAFLIQLKVFLWGLLGLLPLVAIYLVFPGIQSNLLEILAYPSSIAIMVLALLAYCRHAMAPFAMADDPGLGVLNAIRYSKGRMKGFKSAFIMVQFSFLGWFLLRMLLPPLLISTVGPVFSMVFELFVDLALAVYMMASYTAFYLARCKSSPISGETGSEISLETTVDKSNDNEQP